MAERLSATAAEDYQGRYDRAKQADAEKDALISEMIEELETLRTVERQMSYDLETEKNERRRLQQRVGVLDRDAVSAANRRSFVIALIDADADAYIFRRRLLDRDDQGGKEAADEIASRIKSEMQILGIDVDNTDILVRAYANIKGLGKALHRGGKMRENANLASFARGFTQRQGLFDFVDVGSGKEEADEKIRESLRFYASNVQCKHMFLGVCHDAGYAPFLRRFAADRSTRERITLLQSGRIAPSLAALKFRVSTALEPIFIAANVSPTPIAGPTPAASVSGPPFSNPAIKSERLGPVMRDESGRRIDKPLDVNPSAPYVQALRNTKLCQWYYLRGECSGCERVHTVKPLNPREYDCLWSVARQAPCFKVRKGKDCDDAKCFYGHGKWEKG